MLKNVIDYNAGRLLVYPSRVAPEMKNVGGVWDGRVGAWRLPPYVLYAKSALDIFPNLERTPSLDRFLNGREPDMDEFAQLVHDTVRPEYEHIFNDVLYPYQREAVEYLYSSHKPGALLALSPGLGKTAVSMFTARMLNAQSVLVIAPLALLATWERESRNWAGRQLNRAYGVSPTDEWVVTNYDTAVNRPAYAKQKWDIVILDESILVKNRDTKRFKAMKLIRANASRFWLLSGNPVSRYADDLWSQFHLIDPTAFRSYWRFTERYCHLEETNWGTNVIATREDRDLREEFRDLMFIRHQEEVLPDLPEYIVKPVICELTPRQRKAHDELKKSFITVLTSGKEVSADIKLTQMLRMQQVTSSLANLEASELPEGVEGGYDSSKHDAIVDLIREESIEYPAIIWVNWVPGAEQIWAELRARFPKLRVKKALGGDEGNEQTLQDYVDGKVDVLILSLKVGKFGLTMIDTQTVIYLDRTFNADDYIQSRYRVQRIGLTHRPVMLVLKSPNSSDVLIDDNLEGKFVSIAQTTNADLVRLLEGIGR